MLAFSLLQKLTADLYSATVYFCHYSGSEMAELIHKIVVDLPDLPELFQFLLNMSKPEQDKSFLFEFFRIFTLDILLGVDGW